jgi:hypothetical protein
MQIARFFFVFTCTVMVLGATFGAGMYSGVTRNDAFMMFEHVRQAFGDLSETSVLVPSHFLQPARRPGEGVTVHRSEDDGALILLSGFFEGDNQLRLVRRDGSVVRRWPVRFSELFPDSSHVVEPPATDWNADTHGALALPDGSLVFNFEYAGLVRLDRCGGVAWTLPHETHHSVERAEGGGFWVPGRRTVRQGPSEFPPFDVPYFEELVLRVSDEGRIVRAISVPRLLYDNGLETQMTATGDWFGSKQSHDPSLVHMNKIEELTADRADAFPGFEAGDLMLSLRHYNMLVVFDPETLRVKWHQVGPWRRQHDPEFDADGTVVLFNNNVYWPGPQWVDGTPERWSTIQRLDPTSRRVETVFGGREGQEFLSVIRGKVELVDSGGLLITEFEGGRVIETDASGGIVWEYVNRYDESRVAEISEARLYPAGYFAVEDWSCPGE